MKKLILTIHHGFFTLTIVFTIIGLVMVATWAMLNFGSISLALAYFKGESIIVDQPIITLDHVEARSTYKVNFKLINYTNHNIEIIGCDTSCSCTIAQDLPLSIAPSSQVIFSFDYKPQAGQFESVQINLFTNEPAKPELAMTIVVKP